MDLVRIRVAASGRTVFVAKLQACLHVQRQKHWACTRCIRRKVLRSMVGQSRCSKRGRFLRQSKSCVNNTASYLDNCYVARQCMRTVLVFY